jgi:hypothetical protein
VLKTCQEHRPARHLQYGVLFPGHDEIRWMSLASQLI